jgi:MOSC domain-containing protein YiiM
VNVGGPREVRVNGRTVSTAIWKSPVEGRVAIRGVNLVADDQADRSVHGGPDKAVYAYAAEETELWEADLETELGSAPFGENLTVRGLPVSEAVIGERWALGTPCWKSPAATALLQARPANRRSALPKRFAAAGRRGAYLRVLREGDIGAGAPSTS